VPTATRDPFLDGEPQGVTTRPLREVAVANPLGDDLEDVLHRCRPLWEELRGERLLITGGTGFFGCWLLETFLWANERLALGAEAVVLTRRPGAFERKAPHLARHPAVHLIEGDVRTFPFPSEPFPYIVHAATDASAGLNERDPLAMLDTIVAGTRRVLDLALASGCRKLLFTSSGAVYGRQPPELAHVGEDHAGAPDPCAPRSAYGEGKRVAELLCALHAREHRLEVKIARCFAFVGPYLPLDIHYAIGNFIRDAISGKPIVVRGDGTPYRSYLYASDLAAWLWTILFEGASITPYNVGSEEAISIAELARRVGRLSSPPARVEVLGRADPGRPVERYVPSVHRAREQLGLEPSVPLDDAIARTMRWARAAGVEAP
jgi:nucleoside-diphosphate-sugar epimerase